MFECLGWPPTLTEAQTLPSAHSCGALGVCHWVETYQTAPRPSRSKFTGSLQAFPGKSIIAHHKQKLYPRRCRVSQHFEAGLWTFEREKVVWDTDQVDVLLVDHSFLLKLSRVTIQRNVCCQRKQLCFDAAYLKRQHNIYWLLHKVNSNAFWLLYRQSLLCIYYKDNILHPKHSKIAVLSML